jgi:hypothetical protein
MQYTAATEGSPIDLLPPYLSRTAMVLSPPLRRRPPPPPVASSRLAVNVPTGDTHLGLDDTGWTERTGIQQCWIWRSHITRCGWSHLLRYKALLAAFFMLVYSLSYSYTLKWVFSPGYIVSYLRGRKLLGINQFA